MFLPTPRIINSNVILGLFIIFDLHRCFNFVATASDRMTDAALAINARVTLQSDLCDVDPSNSST